MISTHKKSLNVFNEKKKLKTNVGKMFLMHGFKWKREV